MRKPVFVALFCLMIVGFSSVHAQQVFKTTTPSVIGYLEYVPQDYNSNSNKYPVVIFLHGIGERGANSTDPAVLATTIQNVAKLGPPMYVKNGTQFPFILISPQLKNNYGTWPATYVMEVINYVKTYLRIDERRIYLTGLSLGGGGVWMTAQDYPELFAAITPVCGGYNTLSKACNIAGENLPVWAFHGDADTTVPLSRTVDMVNAINNCVPTPSPWAKVSIYAGVGHDAWTNAYKIDNSVHNPNMYQWLMSYTNTINHGNRIPIANAGPDLIKPVPSATITGSATDSDGTISSYLWKQLSGPNTAVLTNATTSTLTASSLVAGDYIFSLKVTDNNGNTETDYVKLTAETANILPVANAGADKTITLPTNTISITGSGSDADGTIAAYAWTKISGPNTPTLTGASTPNLIASNLIAGFYKLRLTVTDNRGATKYDDMGVTVLNPNVLPAVNAGADQTIVLPANTAAITGTATDTDGTITTYCWTKISGGTVTLTGANCANLSLSGLLEGSYAFRFSVTDNRGGTSSDDINVVVLPPNILPVSNAGSDQTIGLPLNTVSITGSGTDADGSITAYLWEKISGSTATLNGTNTSTLSASDLLQGSYVFRLTVTDNRGGTSSDDVSVVVLPPNILPVSNAGADQTIILPLNTVSIIGSGSDVDGTIISYLWEKISGSTATLNGTNTPNLSAADLLQGSYVFRLTVKDNRGGQQSDDVVVTVLNAINILPIANAGPDMTITLPVNSVTIVGSGTDPDGTITSYVWTKLKGGTSTLSGVNTPILSASNLVEGPYIFQLTVTDSRGGTHYDKMLVSVKAAVLTTASMSSVTIVDDPASTQAVDMEMNKAVLADATRAQLKNATVIIYDESGEKIYSGLWNDETYREVFNKKGLYIYNVIREGKRMYAGKIFIR